MCEVVCFFGVSAWRVLGDSGVLAMSNDAVYPGQFAKGEASVAHVNTSNPIMVPCRAPAATYANNVLNVFNTEQLLPKLLATSLTDNYTAFGGFTVIALDKPYHSRARSRNHMHW